MQTIQQILAENTLETPETLRSLMAAHRYLGELKGSCGAIPNQQILLNTLPIQEAEDSSRIENIITTQDEVFKYRLRQSHEKTAAKEVARYNEALQHLFREYQRDKLLTVNMIVAAQQLIVGNDAGVRKQPGTALMNDATGEVIYTPPPPAEVPALLKDLEQFINDDAPLDPIIKMAIIHHQFESIHPFYDGNGRIGRIINILCLIKAGLLDVPVLYLSRYINHNKDEYYRLLQEARTENSWRAWLLYMIDGVALTAQSAIKKIEEIRALMRRCKSDMKANHAKIYSQDLLNNIFKHPYTKNRFLREDLGVSQPTAQRYLEQLAKSGLLTKSRLGRESFYINAPLFAALTASESLAR